MHLPRFRLGTRIFLGFGILIALLLGIASYGSYGLSIVGEEIDVMGGIAGNTNRLQELALQLEVVRRGMADYHIDAQPAALHDVTDAEQRAGALLKESADNTFSEQRRAMFNGLVEKLHGFQAMQEHFVALHDTAVAESARLADIGKALNAAVLQIANAATANAATANGATNGATSDTAAITALRLAVSDIETNSARFLALPDASLVPLIRQDAATASDALTALDRSASTAVKAATSSTHSDIELYVATFDKASSALSGSDALYVDQIRPVMRDMQKVATQALARLVAGFNSTSQKAYGISSDTLTKQLGLSAGATAIGIVLAFLIGRAVVRPLRAMTAVMGKLAAGDNTIEVPARHNKDEIGDMARAVEVFRQHAVEAEGVAAEQAAARATRARRQDAMERHTETFGSSVSAVMQSLIGSTDGIREAASAMADIAVSVHTQAVSTAEGAAQASQELTTVASAVEELTASVQEISRQVGSATAASRQAVERADAGQATISGLSEATGKIGAVVQLISSIASQTNLLALNATIEAARAGDAGKGFAVVAGEVKTLAAQTARATAEISSQIDTVRAATQSAVAAMSEIGAMIRQMDQVSTAIADAVQQQDTTTREIATSVQGVSIATGHAAQAMTEVVAAANKAGAAGRNVLQESNEISSEAGTLRTQVDEFLKAVVMDSGERRRFERIAGNSIRVSVALPGQPAEQAILIDLSETGAALSYRLPLAIGTTMSVTLPDAAGPVNATVVRSNGGNVGVTFASDQQTLERVGRAYQALAHVANAA
jgi:methyl-accepting chemotaxis protein